MDVHRIGAAGGALSLNAALIALALGSFAQAPDTQETPVPLTVVLLAAAERAPPAAEPPAAEPPAAEPRAVTPRTAVPDARSAPAAAMRAAAAVAPRAPAAAQYTRSAPPSAPRVALALPAPATEPATEPAPEPAPAPRAPETPSLPASSPPAAARPGPGASGSAGALVSENRAAAQSTEARRTEPMVDADWRGNPRPPYPELAQRLGEQGEVRIDVFVGAEGRVLDVRLKQSSGSQALDETALRTVRRWRFLPATIDGKPIAQWYHDWQWVFRLDT